MTETPAAFNAADPGQRHSARPYPAENLGHFRWHTGATLRPLAEHEPCPVLFRDLGPVAMAMFLRGILPRLAGPLSPILYMRTVAFTEPYTDYEPIGRLVFLRPLAVQPWHSGVPEVFVARAVAGVDAATVGFVPADVPLTRAELVARHVTTTDEFRAALGGRAYDEARSGTLNTLDRLAAELAASEQRAVPLRGRLQSPDRSVRDRAREEMARVGLCENDVCAAWHHLPRDRRGYIADALDRLPDSVPGGRSDGR